MSTEGTSKSAVQAGRQLHPVFQRQAGEHCLDPVNCADGRVQCIRVLFGRQRCDDADALGVARTQPTKD